MNYHGARPVHLIITIIVDSDQLVVGEELFLSKVAVLLKLIPVRQAYW